MWNIMLTKIFYILILLIYKSILIKSNETNLTLLSNNEEILSTTNENDIIETTTFNTIVTSINNLNNINANNLDKPKSCEEINRKKLEIQPNINSLSKIKKCCPIGESLYMSDDNNEKYCDNEKFNFDIQLIKAVLHDNCIEDLEENFELEIEATNPCNASYVYSQEHGDQIYVLQDGSLLITDKYGNESYEIFNNYCLDTSPIDGNLTAIVCITSLETHISRGQTILFVVFMIISIICLCIVSFLHISIKDLRTVHGLALAILSACLAFGFTFYCHAQLFYDNNSKLGYVVQFCILSYYCWFCILCLNICVTVWYYLPRYKTITRFNRYGRLSLYGFFAFIIPLILVLYTHHKRLPGMPSYFYQGWSESVQQTQRYFIPPISTLVLLGFLFIVGAYFGFRALEKISEIRSGVQYQAILRNKLDEDVTIPSLDQEYLYETKKDARCTVILGCIILFTWLLEVITFYSPGYGEYLAIMEILNGLQGLFILMIFIIARDRRDIIVRWWHDRGSHEVTPVIVPRGKSSVRPGSVVEMKEIKLKNNSSEV